MTPVRERLINVVQGEFMISDEPDVVLTTVLGSCVAVCLVDHKRGIGGMNHFLLPHGDVGGTASMRYGTHAMELLINELLKGGAQRNRLAAKVFGGARMNDNLKDIGARNAAFAHAFLSDEGIPVLAESLGGTSARRIRFWPVSGRVRQLTVENAPHVVVEKLAPIPATPADITLF